MSKMNRGGVGSGWGRGPASLETAPESYPDWAAGAGEATWTDDDGTAERPRSPTADTLVQRSMAAEEANAASVDEYTTFGVVGFYLRE